MPRSARPRPHVNRIEIAFGRDDVDLAAIATGNIVWKTDDPEIRRRLETTYSRDVPTRRVPLAITATVEPDLRLRIVACDDAGHTGEALTDGPLELAQRHPMTVDLLRDQFSRLGDTPFELTEVRLLGTGGPTESLPLPGTQERTQRPAAASGPNARGTTIGDHPPCSI